MTCPHSFTKFKQHGIERTYTCDLCDMDIDGVIYREINERDCEIVALGGEIGCLKAVIERLETAVEMRNALRWIPASVYPIGNGRYLVCCDGEVKVAGFEWDTWRCEGWKIKPTEWMQLPPLPETGK